MERCVVCGRLEKSEQMIGRCCGRCDKLVGDMLAEVACEVSA
jgi:hypothetical protein